MKKRLLLVLAVLAQTSAAMGAPNLIEQFKRDASVEEDKLTIDRMTGAEINALVDEEGKTSLFYCRHLGATLMLLQGADPNVPDNAGRTPAFRAVSHSSDVAYPIMLDLFLLAHADINARDKDGTTLLAWAIREENFPAAKMLLLLGADPAPADVPGDRTPFVLASQGSDGRMTALLNSFTSSGGTRSAGSRTAPALDVATRAARLGEINAALAAGANINARDKDGATVLFQAVLERRADVVALLLLQGADPNIAKNDGTTPLIRCATHSDMASERILMDLLVAGADVNATAKDGTTALSQAVHVCNNTAAQWMIWRGASLDVHSPDGTLMQGAALHADWPSMVDLLRKAGITDPVEPLAKLKDPDLIELARTGTPEAIEAELRKGTRVDVTNRYDQTPLEWAECHDRFDAVDVLLRHGADINHQHKYNGEHVLHTMSTWRPSPAERMEKLVKRGANPNLLMKDGCTPLMRAARTGSPDETIEYLLKVTRDVDARDKEGNTALRLARQHGHESIIKILQAHGAQE